MSGEKVKDFDLDVFVEKVLAQDDELSKKVSASELDATAIIGKAKPSIDKYPLSTGIGYATARLKEAVLEANSESLKGLLVGSRDMFGTNAPIRMPVLNSKGDHKEVVVWGSMVKHGDNKIDIPFPSVANLKVLYDGDYKGVPNIRVVSMESPRMSVSRTRFFGSTRLQNLLASLTGTMSLELSLCAERFRISRQQRGGRARKKTDRGESGYPTRETIRLATLLCR